MRGLVLGFVAVILSLAAIQAAQARVHILNDGADGEPAKILIDSAIRKGDYAAFQRAVARINEINTTRINDVPFITVALHSPGGDVVEAVAIGRAIHRQFMMTLVQPNQQCVSACVFILMAGAVHTPSDSARIGVHRPLLVSWRNMTRNQAYEKYDDLMAYLREYFQTLGVDTKAYDIMMRTRNLGMYYFSPQELDHLGLRGEVPAWKKRYDIRWNGVHATPVRKSFEVIPQIAKLDESFRNVVFMPGAYVPRTDYFAGVDLPELKFTWQSIDRDQTHESAPPPDMMEILMNLAILADSYLRQFWWLVALLVFEWIRGWHTPWPGMGERPHESRLRLAPFAPKTS